MATATSRYSQNNMSSPVSSRPTYNDSFDQPAEPFECDVSAILPVGNISHTSILSGTEDLHDYSIDNDSFAPSTTSFHEQQQSPSNHHRRSLQLQQIHQQQQQQHNKQQQQRSHSNLHRDSYSSKQESEHQDALGSRYLQVENAWYPPQDGDDQEEYLDEDQHQDEEEQLYMYQQGSSQHRQLQQRQQLQQLQQQQQQQRNLRSNNNNDSNMNDNNNYQYDDEPAGGLARLSTIAELSELPSLNITNITNTNNNNNNRHHQSHRHDHQLPPSGAVVVSRDLVLEDLYVEGQDEENERNDEIQRQLLANLKPTDILGPIHETRDFQISSLTGNGKQWERLQSHHHPSEAQDFNHHDGDDQGDYDNEDEQQQQQQQHDDDGDEMNDVEQGSYAREEGESELSSMALALKREYEALFGSKGAIDSERSGSDVTGLVGYDDSGDLYGQEDDYEDDEDDDFFGGEEDVDDQEEEFYAMLDLNGGGNGNMILGNNIPRKPRVLAPPPGSRLPVPGSATKQKLPFSLQSNIVTRLPAARAITTPQPSQPSTPPPQQLPQPTASSSSPRTQLPTFGLRPPQTTTKKSIPTPSVPATQVPSPKPAKPTASILDGLWKEPEYDSQPEESPGAILAAKIAKDIKEDEERKKKLASLGSKPSMLSRPSMLKPPSKLPARSAAPIDNDMDLLTQMLKVESAPVTPLDAPTTSSSSLSRVTPPSGRSIPTPTKVSSVPKSVTQHSRSTTPTANGSTRASALSATKLASTIAPSVTSSASSSPRAGSAIPNTRDPVPTRMATPTRGSGLVAPKVRPSSLYTGNSDHSSSISRTASPIPINTVKSSGLRGSIYDKNTRDTIEDEPLRQSSNKGQSRGKVTAQSKEELRSSTKERLEDLQRRSSYERKKELQRELEEIEAEEEEQQQQQQQGRRDSKDKRSVTPKKLSVRTNSEQRESRRSEELITFRRSDERERERERERDRFSSAPTSPLSPRSPRSGLSSKRSSIYGAHGDRIVPTLEESYKQLAKIRQDIVDLREEIHQDQPGFEPLSSSTGRLGSSKRSSSSRRNSLESKYTRETTNKSRLGRSESFDSGNEDDRATSPSPAQNKRLFSILGKISRTVLSGSSSNLDSGLSSSQHKAQSPKSSTASASSHKKGQASSSTSNPLKTSRTMTDAEPRSTHLNTRAMSRQQSNPISPTQKYNGYEDRHHSGSSGQSEEFSDELAYQSQSLHGRQGYQQQHQSQGRRYDQQQYASNQQTHHFRQADDGSLILSEKPDIIGGGGSDEGCPAQIRPKEVVFSSSVAGEVQSFVTLYNRSRRKMHFEILRPAGITVTPSYGMIQPGRDQRLTIHLAEMRGPGRVVVELDGEWLVPFGISFE
ncbi:hypothetical protein BGZ76_001220 [Entomortierella beljakovae]|nr:hypothetical protein BGZ76_001220 [Entomortierella beljakovae]